MTPYPKNMMKWLSSKSIEIDHRAELLSIIQKAPMEATHVNKHGVFARPNLISNTRFFVFVNEKWVQALHDAKVLNGTEWMKLTAIRDFLSKNS